MIKHLFCGIFILFWQLINAQKSCDSLIFYFDHDKYLINTKVNKLDSILADKSVSVEINIAGYTDHLGSSTHNNKLSQQRADQLKNSITQQYISALIKSCIGKGEIDSSNQSGIGAPKNRKAVVSYCIIKPENIVETIPVMMTDTLPNWKTGETIILKGLNFRPGQHNILPESAKTLEELRSKMNNNPTLKISIHGHVCCLPDDEVDGLDNETGKNNLSLARAKYIYDFLIENGIASERMTYKGFSNSQPKTWPEVTEADRISNRRVEILIISQ